MSMADVVENVAVWILGEWAWRQYLFTFNSKTFNSLPLTLNRKR